MWTQEMFGVEKPIIALLHLDALPGDPGYCGSMDTVLEHARQDLLAPKLHPAPLLSCESPDIIAHNAALAIQFIPKEVNYL